MTIAQSSAFTGAVAPQVRQHHRRRGGEQKQRQALKNTAPGCLAHSAQMVGPTARYSAILQIWASWPILAASQRR